MNIKPPSLFLTLIVPTYNESLVIESSLRSITSFLDGRKHQYEIIICDDGSTDDTAAKVSNLKIKGLELLSLPHRGKGYAVKAGMRKARGEFVVFMDADLSTPIDELDKLLEELQQGAEIVIGSRRVEGLPSEHRQPVLRHIAGNIYARIVRTLFLPRVKDPQCGFKGFRHSAAIRLAELGKVDGFAFDTELLLMARKLNITVKEIPVAWQDSGNSSVSLLRDGFKMFAELTAIYFRINFGSQLNKGTKHENK